MAHIFRLFRQRYPTRRSEGIRIAETAGDLIGTEVSKNSGDHRAMDSAGPMLIAASFLSSYMQLAQGVRTN